MGMDVFGREPSSKHGEYFRNNVWYWRPLAELCIHFAPEICSACTYWHSNDGDGLDGDDALLLAEVLEARHQDGSLADYISRRDEELSALPDVTCHLCNGSGVRTDKIGKKTGLPKMLIAEKDHPRDGERGWCNGCNGTGGQRPFQSNYPCTLENVVEFTAFLKHCGGFNIH